MGMQGGPGGPLLVRRKGAALPADLDLGGALTSRVDWCWSTLLNLVIQTSFQLTVAACRRALCLHSHAQLVLEHHVTGGVLAIQSIYRGSMYACRPALEIISLASWAHFIGQHTVQAEGYLLMHAGVSTLQRWPMPTASCRPTQRAW